MRKGIISVLSSVISILVGLLFGLLLLLLVNSGAAFSKFGELLTAGVSSSAKLAKVLYQAAPLVMTGLSVAFAFKTGLFNIGASGQYTVGAFAALIFAIIFQMPWWVCLIAAMVAGGIWGFFPGLFKALFNVNEVITSIMLNWIGMFAVNLSLMNIKNAAGKLIMLPPAWVNSPIKDRTADLSYANPSAIIPKAGLDKLFDSNYMNISIFIAILFAVVLWVVLNRTTFGYELKACGNNKNASIYAGINAKRNIVLSMVIAGAMAGVGGGLYYLSGTAAYNIQKVLLPMGFNGISVALLATSNPIGTIFSALFISYIQVGGESLQPVFAKEMIDIIIAVIIYLSAFALLTKTILGRFIKTDKTNVNDDKAVEAEAAAEQQKEAELKANEGAGILPPTVEGETVPVEENSEESEDKAE
ncbi:MAG: ABC transporter permease [Eubacteriales bacterium]|nr:ABC transporter permease [Eubacteriales bacterium]